jgi:glycine/D-amino acid oxidase-like deaminating enzyme
MNMRRFDALIVGSGPAGSVAAAVLARGGARVALVDKARFPRDKACGDLVGPRGVQLLDDLGIRVTGAVPVGDLVVVGPTARRLRLPSPHDLAQGNRLACANSSLEPPTVDNSRCFAHGILLPLLVLRGLAQRSGLDCLQGEGRGFEPRCAQKRATASTRPDLCHSRGDPIASLRIGIPAVAACGDLMERSRAGVSARRRPWSMCSRC